MCCLSPAMFYWLVVLGKRDPWNVTFKMRKAFENISMVVCNWGGVVEVLQYSGFDLDWLSPENWFLLIRSFDWLCMQAGRLVLNFLSRWICDWIDHKMRIIPMMLNPLCVSHICGFVGSLVHHQDTFNFKTRWKLFLQFFHFLTSVSKSFNVTQMQLFQVWNCAPFNSPLPKHFSPIFSLAPPGQQNC